MDYIGTILEILKAGLNLWANKEAHKYLDLVLKIETELSNERKKPVYVEGMPKNGNYRDDRIVDDGLRRLATIGRGFATASRAPGASSVP